MDPVIGKILFDTAAAGVQTIFGNNAAADAKKAQDKANQRAQKYNKKVWRVDNKNIDRAYEVAVENQDIQHRNNEAELKFLEDGRRKDYDYQMGIRDFRFAKEQEAYFRVLSDVAKQKDLNQLASEQALLEQQRYLQENLVNLAFTESQMMMDFAAATAGLKLKRGQARGQAALTKGQAAGQAQLSKQRIQAETTLGIKQARTETQLARQQATIESLEERGRAMVTGQAGRSSRKVAQGIRAKAGAQQASLVEQFLLAEEGALQKQLFDVQSIEQQLLFTQQNVVQQLLFTEQGIDLNLTQLNGQLEMDKLQMKATRDNLSAADALSRKRIALELKQANTLAESRIPLEPEKAPPLPEPLTLPRPERLKIFKPEGRPEPIKKASYVPDNSAATIAQTIDTVGSSLIKSGVLNDLFNFGRSGGVGASNPWGAGNVTGIENNFGSTMTFYSGGPGQLDY